MATNQQKGTATDHRERVAKARELGAAAFHRGTRCAPAADNAALVPLYYSQPHATKVAIFRAWSAAWIAESLAAPLPEEQET